MHAPGAPSPQQLQGRSRSILPKRRDGLATEKFAIATIADEKYLPAACCQLKSSWDHLRSKEQVRFHLVICDVSSENRDEAERFFSDRGMSVDISNVAEIADRIRPINQRWPRSAYIRLYFDSIFPPDIERLIYFDADTRVCASLEPLLNVPLHGAPIGAVHDFIYYVTGNIRRRRHDLFLPPDAPYLQSGVMVFDWAATLKDDGLARARHFLWTNPDRCQEAPDQDALNAAFAGKWTPINPRWNLHETYLMFGGNITPYVEHYTSAKPWSRQRPAQWRDASDWYARELMGTKWARFVQRQSEIDAAISQVSFFKSRWTRRTYDALVRYAPFAFSLLGRPRDPSGNDFLPWSPRSRRDVEDMVDALIAEAEQRCPRLLPPETVLVDAP